MTDDAGKVTPVRALAIQDVHIPAEDLASFGVTPASAGKLSSFTMTSEPSQLDKGGNKRGKVSKLDGQAVEGEVSPLDK